MGMKITSAQRLILELKNGVWDKQRGRFISGVNNVVSPYMKLTRITEVPMNVVLVREHT